MSVWKPTEKIKYIDKKWLDKHGIKLSPEELEELETNEKKLGIQIDWEAVKKEYNRLGIPKDTYSPLKADVLKVGYVIDLSDRSRGKTTNKLILGLILFKMYGIVLHYVRQRKSECERKMLADLYKTVLDYNYIEKIFGNTYNSIFFYGKRWFLCRVDETGEIVDKCEDNCTFCIGLDESDSLKSTYNAPRGDMIFHDEFITSVYGYNDFIRFCDICKTIIRDRISPVIYMSANTINKESPWFAEMGLEKVIQAMEMGDYEYVETVFGTHIYLEILEENVSGIRENVNKRFWGFNNDKLISITGKGTWATENYPHIPIYRDDEDEKPRILQNILFINMNSKYVKLQLVNDAQRGICVFVQPATKIYPDSVVLTCDEITDKRQAFAMGFDTFNFVKAYWKLYEQNKFYYARNSEGAFIKAYISYSRTKLGAMRR